MTYASVIEKFLIEYDKADITSSYPSLTDYEIATILDKAYLALIAQKVTGTNFRRAGFEADVKAVEDMRSLMQRSTVAVQSYASGAQNEWISSIPTSFLYLIEGSVDMEMRGEKVVAQPAVLMSHDAAQTYKTSTTNLPWIKNPVIYLEGNYIHILIDQYKYPYFPVLDSSHNANCSIVYIKQPTKFVDVYGNNESPEMDINDSMVEELINLAIIMSTEIVESTRLQGKINTSALES